MGDGAGAARPPRRRVSHRGPHQRIRQFRDAARDRHPGEFPHRGEQPRHFRTTRAVMTLAYPRRRPGEDLPLVPAFRLVAHEQAHRRDPRADRQPGPQLRLDRVVRPGRERHGLAVVRDGEVRVGAIELPRVRRRLRPPAGHRFGERHKGGGRLRREKEYVGEAPASGELDLERLVPGEETGQRADDPGVDPAHVEKGVQHGHMRRHPGAGRGVIAPAQRADQRLGLRDGGEERGLARPAPRLRVFVGHGGMVPEP